jgi:hypothetical protein
VEGDVVLGDVEVDSKGVDIDCFAANLSKASAGNSYGSTHLKAIMQLSLALQTKLKVRS